MLVGSKNFINFYSSKVYIHIIGKGF